MQLWQVMLLRDHGRLRSQGQRGTFHHTVSHHTLPRQLLIFYRQDPYCIVKVGGQQLRTKTAKAGGRNPVW